MKYATLLYNPRAGDEPPEVDRILTALQTQGYDVRSQSTKEKGWKKVLEKPGDLVVAAGGDGTVYKIAARLLGSGTPLMVLPEGTANNFASSLGLREDSPDLIASMDGARSLLLDIGIVRGWPDEERFFEACGAGLFAQTVIAAESGVLPEPDDSRRTLQRNRRLLQATLAAYAPAAVTVIADGDDLSGDYLAVEVMNLPIVGPGLPIAPDATPTDGLLDLVLISRREVHALERLLEGGDGADYPVRKVRQVMIESDQTAFHLDEQTLEPDSGPLSLTLTVERGALTILVPE